MTDRATPDVPFISPEILLEEMQNDISSLMTQNAALRGLIRIRDAEIAQLRSEDVTTPEPAPEQ